MGIIIIILLLLAIVFAMNGKEKQSKNALGCALGAITVTVIFILIALITIY